MEPSEFLPRLAEKEDLGLGLIGYVIGYCVDAWFFPGGLSSGVVAALSAAGIVGVKNVLSRFLDKSREWEGSLRGDELIERGDKLATYIESFLKLVDAERDHPFRVLLRELEGQYLLLKNGIITERDYDRFLDKVALKCRGTIEVYLAKRRQLS